MPITASNPFKGRQYPGEVIVCAYVGIFATRFPMSTSSNYWRNAEWKWTRVVSCAGCRLTPPNSSTGLDRSDGRFLLTAKRDKAAAKRFLVKAIEASGNPMPRVMNVDKNPAYPAAMEDLKATGVIPRRVLLRQCGYLNNVIEQDHRSVKNRVWLAKGYGSFQSAWRTLQGFEEVSMIRKGAVRTCCVTQNQILGESF
jgi:DDE domain